MINDILQDVETRFGLSLLADEDAIWKRGIKQTTERLQEALNKTANCGEKWGLKISVKKAKYFVGNKKT